MQSEQIQKAWISTFVHKQPSTPPIDTTQAAAILTLSAPAEVSGLETHGTELHVSTTATHGVHTVGTKLGHGRGTAHFVHSLLLEVSLSTTGRSALVSTVTRDSYTPILKMSIWK